MRRPVIITLAAVLAIASASCAPKAMVPASVGALRYPDFVYPAPLDRVGDLRLRARHEAAWRQLQAGNVRAAEAEFADILRQQPSYYPSAAGWGYSLVAGGRAKDALLRFDQAIRLAPRYAPALAGRAEALLAAGQRDAAIAGFEAAFASDNTLADLPRRIDALTFDRVSEHIREAKRAADAGQLDAARAAYVAALEGSPESAFLHRDLGLIEWRRKDLASAVVQLERAIALDPDDARAHAGLADVLTDRGDIEGATAALERAYDLDPSDALKQRLDRVRDRAETGPLPPEYAAIGSLAQVTRGDLAALVGVRLRTWLAASRGRSASLATDIRGHWASTWILGVVRTGLMDVYPNHTFQPRAVVRRADLAQVVSRALAAGRTAPGPAARGRLAMGDVSVEHLRYADIVAAVSSGVMALEGGMFRPSRPVSGPEAVETMQRLERAVRQGRIGER